MFNSSAYDELHIQLRSSVALTVFAVGRFVHPINIVTAEMRTFSFVILFTNVGDDLETLPDSN